MFKSQNKKYFLSQTVCVSDNIAYVIRVETIFLERALCSQNFSTRDCTFITFIMRLYS